MKLTILNDVHLGASRSAGTTPATQQQLKQHLQTSFEALLPESDLMILGDLMDKGTISAADLLPVFTGLSSWLVKGHRLWLVAGNHDLTRTSTDLSSFDLLCSLLLRLYPDTVTVVKGGGVMTDYGYVIPHVANQDLFDLEMAKVPECDYLFVHVNIDNHFAAQSDQSLNLCKDQIVACKAKQVVCAHEHDLRTFGKVTIPGNQIASSVSDWLNPSDKFFVEIEDGVLQLVKCADRDEQFVQMDWKALAVTDHKFVRVIGAAPADESSSVLSAINALRRSHPAFVITNAVTVVSDEGVAVEFEQNLEAVQAFSVWGALAEVLSADEIKILEGLKNA